MALAQEQAPQMLPSSEMHHSTQFPLMANCNTAKRTCFLGKSLFSVFWSVVVLCFSFKCAIPKQVPIIPCHSPSFPKVLDVTDFGSGTSSGESGDTDLQDEVLDPFVLLADVLLGVGVAALLVLEGALHLLQLERKKCFQILNIHTSTKVLKFYFFSHFGREQGRISSLFEQF